MMWFNKLFSFFFLHFAQQLGRRWRGRGSLDGTDIRSAISGPFKWGLITDTQSPDLKKVSSLFPEDRFIYVALKLSN